MTSITYNCSYGFFENSPKNSRQFLFEVSQVCDCKWPNSNVELFFPMAATSSRHNWWWLFIKSASKSQPSSSGKTCFKIHVSKGLIGLRSSMCALQFTPYISMAFRSVKHRLGGWSIIWVGAVPSMPVTTRRTFYTVYFFNPPLFRNKNLHLWVGRTWSSGWSLFKII